MFGINKIQKWRISGIIKEITTDGQYFKIEMDFATDYSIRIHNDLSWWSKDDFEYICKVESKVEDTV